MFVLKQSYICYYIICMTVPLRWYRMGQGGKAIGFTVLSVWSYKTFKNFMAPFYGWGSTASRL